MSDDPDTPYDPSLRVFASRHPGNDGARRGRMLKAEATKRRLRARQMSERGDHQGAERACHDAAFLERQADRLSDPLLAVGSPPSPGIGGEVVSADPETPSLYQNEVRQPPDLLAAEATEHRLALTGKVSGPALTLGLEMTESIGARNAVERNLVHQIAVMHALAMTLAARASGFAADIKSFASEPRQQVHSIEAARMTRAAARALEASQRGMLTLERLRNGGQQVVMVQYVNVQEGGAAVVAGRMDRGEGQK
ncbi:hypothetical protein JMJ55_27945 [Belnapia sp. T6]|uniref:Uncharacterized protein n=1 Tax=Belnapia mucosa TaxID=2804532 RepID=A0ABS1VBV7_9PROT|nr:hypothetical protein [Belnapia mucosa]MBL6459159.1 hypothetical protein [Belnapia mucosa]